MDSQEQSAPQQQGRLIARVLTPAIKLWLRSQLDSIENLQLEIDSGNRELLSGAIPKVFLSTSAAVYKGIHLSRVQVIAQNIKTNLRQVLRGKAIQLLNPLPIELEASLTAADLAASTEAALFQEALQMGLMPLIEKQLSVPSDWPFPNWQPRPVGEPHALTLSALRMELACDRLRIHAQVQHPAVQTPEAIVLETGLKRVNPHELCLDHPRGFHVGASQPMPLPHLGDFGFDLGSDVRLTLLNITTDAICCRGQIKIMPVQAAESDLD